MQNWDSSTILKQMKEQVGEEFAGSFCRYSTIIILNNFSLYNAKVKEAKGLKEEPLKRFIINIRWTIKSVSAARTGLRTNGQVKFPANRDTIEKQLW